jgi:hypothetical protein
MARLFAPERLEKSHWRAAGRQLVELDELAKMLLALGLAAAARGAREQPKLGRAGAAGLREENVLAHQQRRQEGEHREGRQGERNRSRRGVALLDEVEESALGGEGLRPIVRQGTIGGQLVQRRRPENPLAGLGAFGGKPTKAGKVDLQRLGSKWGHRKTGSTKG